MTTTMIAFILFIDMFFIAQSLPLCSSKSCRGELRLLKLLFQSNLYGSSSQYDDVEGEIFGSEFLNQLKNPVDFKKRPRKAISPAKRAEVMQGFDRVRSTFLMDGLFIGALGLSLTMFVGTYKDSLSYGVGATLGIAYSLLLGKYVENIGSKKISGGADSARFIPAVLLIVLYGKYKDIFSIIPELWGFFSTYKIATLLQIFNRNLYGDAEDMDAK